MDTGLVHLIIAAGSFVITHFAMSGPLRAGMVAAWREQGFLTFYSLISIAMLGWTIVAFDRAPVTGAAWDGMHPLAWIAGSILTIASLALLLPSFKRNPALPGVKAAGLGTVIPSGVFTITRHPMMWGITLWALGHIVVAPTAPVLILMAALILVALLGSHFQDKRKLAQNKREFNPWQRRTSFWPDLRKLGNLKLTWVIAFLVWFLITIVHWELFGIPAGPWLWIA
ncbi:putative membrane protein [Novosphingobium hassiacum]|uniref:Putative membrane protein n=1 Tax=Novosphingobium hassiacum TaxID=173676 RepID=A0A7W5ZWR2_9SPHN|nr:NnrU family protein [Novosphingobium hassiacum]MBB3859904.1 putative membrane protein [Novosphingobium hassiacum]